MAQTSMLAMILASGRGSRLHDLTNKVAKPAVSYGGKYRIIDFPLSNCANSGVDIVGVLTQYESVLLNSYVAAGGRWGLDTKDSGVFVLTPREKADCGLDVYRGTADAISQNIDFVDAYDPEYILILSGDHIYKMNPDAGGGEDASVTEDLYTTLAARRDDTGFLELMGIVTVGSVPAVLVDKTEVILVGHGRDGPVPGAERIYAFDVQSNA